MLYEIRSAPRVVLVDPKCSQLASLPFFYHLWPEYDEQCGKWTSPLVGDYFGKHLKGHLRVAIHFRSFHKENLELLCGMMLPLKNCILAVDELGLFLSPGPAGALPRNVTSIVVSGTHDGITLIGTAQRPSLVHGTVRSNASRMLFYRLTERADLEIARGYLPADFAERLASLPDFVPIDHADNRDPFEDASLVGKLKKYLPGNR